MKSSDTVGVLLPVLVLVPSASPAALSCGGTGHLDKHCDGDEGCGGGELESSGLERAEALQPYRVITGKKRGSEKV